jgi:hypothetical protein
MRSNREKKKPKAEKNKKKSAPAASPCAIHARTVDRERRFGQKIRVAGMRSIVRQKSETASS